MFVLFHQTGEEKKSEMITDEMSHSKTKLNIPLTPSLSFTLNAFLQQSPDNDGHHPLLFVYADVKNFSLKNEFMFGWLLPSAIHVIPYNI